VKREEILEVYEKGPEAVVELVESLWEIILPLEARVKSLEDLLAQNSRNSSRPPSSDGYEKPQPKSQRKVSGKKPGGQKGHPGHTLKKAAEPDHTLVHSVGTCEKCHQCLEGKTAVGHDSRQVFDLPPMKLEVTEHQAEKKLCDCGHVTRAAFPEGVTQPTQYGPGVKSLEVYLSQYQLLPFERIQELFMDLFGHPPSQGTLVNMNEACYEGLDSMEEAIKEALVHAGRAHFDETGFRIEGERQWLHVASTETLTCYASHAKRGTKAMDSMDILPRFKGRAVHDHWDSYFHYENCAHALCNDHHLRELTYIHERFDQEWAQEMKALLLDAKALVEERKEVTTSLNTEDTRRIEDAYQNILLKGFEANPEIPRDLTTKKRGPKKRTKPQNLLRRLSRRREETLAFIYDFNIPFGNNQGERDIRMMKVKQKISGTFRSEKGAKIFCRIRGYISTMKKQGQNVLEAIKSVFDGTPLVPALE